MRLAVGKRALVATLLVLTLLVAIVTGVKSYELWPQVTYIWDFKSNPIIEFSNGNPHALRYAVVYPIFVFSDYFQMNYDEVFSYVAIGFLLWTFLSTCNVLNSLGHDVSNNLAWLFFVGGVMMSLFLLMNGRASFAFLGYSMLLAAVTQFHFGERVSLLFPLQVLLAVTLCGVTSGTLFSALGSYSIFLFFELRNAARRGRIKGRFVLAALSALAVAYSLTDVVLILVEKNLVFFGGGLDAVFAMLKHGAGAIIEPVVDSIDPLLAVFLAGIVALAVYIQIVSSRNRFILGIMAMAIGLGAFGFTTMSLAAIPVTVTIVVYLRGRLKFS